MNTKARFVRLGIIFVFICIFSPVIAEEIDDTAELFGLSLEQLSEIQVYTVSRKEESLLDTPAAITVITAEDIHRSGLRSIPELLRMVPGIQVSRINSGIWSVSSRGFSGHYADKMQVMIDGRSVFDPLFNGVYWEMQNLMLEDIERIEVIRGPGGTLWGNNAVNGIISIVTKNAKDTQGGLLSGGGGDYEEGFGNIRYGGMIDENTYYRAYGTYFNRDDQPLLTGGSGNDAWHMWQGGFRIDSTPTADDTFTLQGDLFKGMGQQRTNNILLTAPYSQQFAEAYDLNGGNILARWTHAFDDGSEMQLQTYYDRSEYRYSLFKEMRDSYNIDFQHRFELSDMQEITWGLSYNLNSDTTQGVWWFNLDPRTRDLHTYSAFVQDRFSLTDKLSVIVGSKFSHNEFTGWEWQPGARALYKMDETNSIWASITRAVATPGRYDNDIFNGFSTFPAGMFTGMIGTQGNDKVDSEKLLAYEVGYRTQPNEKLFLDFALFFNDYHDITTLETGSATLKTSPSPYLWTPFNLDNKQEGETYGGEVSMSYHVSDTWHLKANYSFIQMQMHMVNNSNSTADGTEEGKTPHNQFHLSSYLDLPYDLALDCGAFYVDNVPGRDVNKYIRFDARLGWHPTENFELSIVGQNLFDPTHPEYSQEDAVIPTEIDRSFYLKATYRF